MRGVYKLCADIYIKCVCIYILYIWKHHRHWRDLSSSFPRSLSEYPTKGIPCYLRNVKCWWGKEQMTASNCDWTLILAETVGTENQTNLSTFSFCPEWRKKGLKRGDKFITNYTIILLCSASNKLLQVLSANSSVKKIIAWFKLF